MRSRIKLIRQELGLNQMELAEMASISRQTMSKLENGNYKPSLKLAYKITLLLGFKHIHEVFIFEKEELEIDYEYKKTILSIISKKE